MIRLNNKNQIKIAEFASQKTQQPLLIGSISLILLSILLRLI